MRSLFPVGQEYFITGRKKPGVKEESYFFKKMEEIALEGVPKSQLEAAVRFRSWNGQLGVGVGVRVGLAWEGSESQGASLNTHPLCARV